MRLTLRTLLAYLDRILEPADAHELEQKVRESEIANQLVKRIHSVLGSRQAEALPLDAQGLGRNANSVAEYLDNTLPPQEVPDFERICLDSDGQLAEVAACHQILTLVLGEPAAVSPSLKQKIYRLDHPTGPRAEASPTVRMDSHAGSEAPVTPGDAGSAARWTTAGEVSDVAHRVDSGIRPASSTPAQLASAAAVAPTRRGGRDEDEHWTEAPDYLTRSRRNRGRQVVLAALIGLCLALAAIFGMGPLDQNHPLAKGYQALTGRHLAMAPGDEDSANEQPTVNDAAGNGKGRELRGGKDAGLEIHGADSAATAHGDETTAGQDAMSGAAETDAEDAGNVAATDADATFDSPESVDLTGAGSNEPATTEDPTQGDDRSLSPARSRWEELTGEPSAADSLESEGAVPMQLEPADELASDMPLEALDNGPGNEALEADLDADEPNAASDDLAGNVDLAADEPAVDVPGENTFVGDAAGIDNLTANNDSVEPTAVNPPEPPPILNPLARNVPAPSREPREPVPALPTRADVADRGGISTADRLRDDGLHLEAPPEIPKAVDVGRFLDRQQVLIKQDRAAQIWQRVPTGERLQVGDLLMSLPTYRVPLVLASGMQVSLIGATRLEVAAPDADNTPYFRLGHGRLLIATFAQAGTKFGLRWDGEREALITLADMNTTLAVELQNRHLPGSDPTATTPHQLLNVMVTSGNASWSSPGSEAVQIAAGQRLTVVDSGTAQVTELPEMPRWIDGSDARPRDAIAARTLAGQLVEGRPITLVLQEETEGFKLDNRSLAICSLAYMGDATPLIVALNDATFQAYWNAQYETLVDVVSLSNESAERIRAALVQRHGADQGEKVFRLLWGYSPVQLQEGAAAQLVSALEASEVDMRFIANERLKEITGQPSLYRANAAERNSQRRAATIRWRKLLESGGVVYAEVPELVKLLQTEQTQP